ncbi:MAG: putative metal-binding motif-containing protein [bacterium]
MRRLLLLALAATAWRCEPAEPILGADADADAVPAADADPALDAALALDRALPCPDTDEDGILAADCAPAGQPRDCDDTDPRVRPGASDPCGDGIDQDCDGSDPECPAGCEPAPAITPCDARDDDCDGVVDECELGHLCDADRCLGDVDAPCAADDPCAAGLTCTDGRCARLEPGGLCETIADCPRDATCSREIACDPDFDRCYGLQGGRCTGSCDCSGVWLCADESRRCVTCIIDAQCDAPARCTPAGLCAAPITLGGPDVDALDALLAELLTCAEANRDTSVAQGCRIIDTARLTVAGVEVGALVPPDPATLCAPDAFSARGFDPAAAAALADLFGCAGPRRVEWDAPLPAERPAAACLTHLPPWARPALAAPSIVIAPCADLVYARD